MKIIKSIIAAGFIAISGALNAATAIFDFTFFDDNGQQFGSGSVSFVDYTGSGSSMKSFRSVDAYSWNFEIPYLGINIGSSDGDSITLALIQSQGFVVTGNGEHSPRSLTFFDRLGEGIFSSDSDAADLTGIRFSAFTNDVEFVVEGEIVGNGSFLALESPLSAMTIPEPATVVLGSLGLLGLLRRRRCS